VLFYDKIKVVIKMSYQKDLNQFKKFLENYQFQPLEVKDVEENIGECEEWINVGYNFSGTYPKLLSNLFPYTFTYKGITFHSIEGFFQGIKFMDPNLQKQVFLYSGKEAAVLSKATTYDWTKTGEIYFQGKRIQRDSKEYDNLVLEIYISAIQNPFYRNALKNCPLPIIHLIGEKDKSKTVFTRFEFEYMLNALHEYLNTIEEETYQI
jgi:hypothetical protein